MWLIQLLNTVWKAVLPILSLRVRVSNLHPTHYSFLIPLTFLFHYIPSPLFFSSGRVSMLATLGIVVQGFNTKIIPGFPVTETNEIEALKKVYYEAPSALFQVSGVVLVEIVNKDHFLLFSFWRLHCKFCMASKSDALATHIVLFTTSLV